VRSTNNKFHRHRHQVIIAIDFGTHGTGIEYANDKKVRVNDSRSAKLRPIEGTGDIPWILTVPTICTDRAEFKMERYIFIMMSVSRTSMPLQIVVIVWSSFAVPGDLNYTMFTAIFTIWRRRARRPLSKQAGCSAFDGHKPVETASGWRTTQKIQF